VIRMDFLPYILRIPYFRIPLARDKYLLRYQCARWSLGAVFGATSLFRGKPNGWLCNEVDCILNHRGDLVTLD